MTLDLIIGSVVAAAVFGFIFLPGSDGMWSRTWLGAAALSTVSLVSLTRHDRLGDAIGTTDATTVGVGVGVGVAWLLVTHVGHAVLCRLVPGFLDQVRELYAFALGDRSLTVAGPIVVMAAAEELFFRGFVQYELGLAVGVAAYLAVQVFEWNWALAVAALLGAVVWGGLYEWQDSLVAAFLAHVIWTGTLAFFWPLRGCDGEQIPEAEAVAVID